MFIQPQINKEYYYRVSRERGGVTWGTRAGCGVPAVGRGAAAGGPLSCPWCGGPRAAHSAAGERGCRRLFLSPCSPAERAAHYATRRPPCCRPASRLVGERRALTRLCRAAMPTDLDALLRRRECNRHTYSRLVPINASTTKAACDGECGRIWQQMQWVRHVRASYSLIRGERDGTAHCDRGLHSSSLLP